MKVDIVLRRRPEPIQEFAEASAALRRLGTDILGYLERPMSWLVGGRAFK